MKKCEKEKTINEFKFEPEPGDTVVTEFPTDNHGMQKLVLIVLQVADGEVTARLKGSSPFYENQQGYLLFKFPKEMILQLFKKEK